MPENSGKRCLVALDAPAGPIVLELLLPVAATIDAALAIARSQSAGVAVDWERGATGVWGQPCARSAVPRDGERIELYRALPADPRQRRRQRARLRRPGT